MKIGVTGVGGGVGQSLIKALGKTSYKVVGFDSEPLGAGLYLVNEAYKIPYASDSSYIDTLIERCQEAGIKILFPGLDPELSKIASNRELFKKAGIIPIISSEEVIAIANDKLKTSEFMNKHGIPHPTTVKLSRYLQQRDTIPFPLIIKPVSGARSRNVFFVSEGKELDYLIQSVIRDQGNYIVQNHIGGDEYTVGTVGFHGKSFGMIILRRILRDGDTYKCFVEEQPAVRSVVQSAVDALKPFGACNVQLRVENGKAYILEINARCSGTTAARALAGFNEPQMICDYLLTGKAPKYTIRELTILRYWNELPVENKYIEQMRNYSRITNYKKLSL